jgi:prophage DNA circulation protein
MSQISDVLNPWRQLLIGQPASFRGVMFHVDSGSRGSGRRAAPHEYPKRNDGYVEDMGRKLRRFQFAGYLVYRPRRPDETNPMLYDYVSQRKLLYQALEADDAGLLIHPVFCPGTGMQVICDSFSMTESRDKGGFTQFDMVFLEAGSAVKAGGVGVDTQTDVGQQADAADQTALGLMPTDL